MQEFDKEQCVHSLQGSTQNPPEPLCQKGVSKNKQANTNQMGNLMYGGRLRSWWFLFSQLCHPPYQTVQITWRKPDSEQLVEIKMPFRNTNTCNEEVGHVWTYLFFLLGQIWSNPFIRVGVVGYDTPTWHMKSLMAQVAIHSERTDGPSGPATPQW